MKQEKLPNDSGIVELFRGLGEPVRVAVEATRSWYWLYRSPRRKRDRGKA